MERDITFQILLVITAIFLCGYLVENIKYITNINPRKFSLGKFGASFMKLLLKYNNGGGALLCGKNNTIIGYGFDHHNQTYYCPSCKKYILVKKKYLNTDTYEYSGSIVGPLRTYDSWATDKNGKPQTWEKYMEQKDDNLHNQ